MLKTRISVPSVIKRNSVITIKTLVSHPMETGFRSDARGALIPRDILTQFTCLYNDRLVVDMQLHPAIAANPYFAFKLMADVSGTLKFVWRDQHGGVTTATRELNVING